MAYHDTKQAAVDPDNPGPTEQIPYSEWNTMVEDFRRKIHEIAVDITALGDDKILVYKAASASFVIEVVNAISALNNLSDVTISGVPANDEVLAYSMAAGKWINQTAAEAGLATSTDLAAHLPLAGGTIVMVDYRPMTPPGGDPSLPSTSRVIVRIGGSYWAIERMS